MIKRVSIVVLLMCLTACGGSSANFSSPTASGNPPTGSQATGAPVAGATGAASGGSTAAATGTPGVTKSPVGLVVDGVPVTSISDAVCVFVDRENLKLASVASNPAAQAKFASQFKAWTAKNKNLAFEKGEVDQITKSQCPEVRSRLLTTLGGTSFTKILS